jgi:cell division protein ZipA
MQTNWSLIFNVVLLACVVMTIVFIVRSRKAVPEVKLRVKTPAVITPESQTFDDILAVRKIIPDPVETCVISPVARPAVQVVEESAPATITEKRRTPDTSSIMMFLLAKDNRQLAGYELLQTVLAAGLRFGEGQLFHRHQYPNGQGPVLCSLAAATASGVFDLQNIGAFMVRGLCLFMQASGNATIDGERFEIMLDTARLLSEGLDTYLLDDKRQPLSEKSIARYCTILGLHDNQREETLGIVDEETV